MIILLMKLKSFMKPWSSVLSVVLMSSPFVKGQAEQAAPFMPATSVKRLSQGWSQWQSDWFHSTTQGSKFMPYAFFVALEQADSQKPFNSAENLERFRCIPRPSTKANPDHLPIGFVADPSPSLPSTPFKDTRSIGFTCAACHTAQINYKGTSLLIDGGPTLADMSALIVAIKDAVVATTSDPKKLDRFAKKVLGDEYSPAKRDMVEKELKRTAASQASYLRMNRSPVPYGFARMDAFGRIFNNALVAVGSKDRVVPDAPVSYPFLWDTVRSDCVQWTGNAPNGLIGSLGRNVGEVVGVFGEIDSKVNPLPHGYASSVNFKNLIQIEKSLHGLKHPAWPEDVLGRLDPHKVKAGAALFKQLRCDHCHPRINPFSWLPFVRTFTSHLTNLEDTSDEEGVHTDATAAALIRDSVADSGRLSGQPKIIDIFSKYGKIEPVKAIVDDTVVRTLIGKLENKKLPVSNGKVLMSGNGLNQVGNLNDLMPMSAELKAAQKARQTIPLVYRARPLDGIWATGPFLHNGSVPTLYDLLLPEGRRPKTFAVGNREFDPVKVGANTTPNSETQTFDTRLKGNSNKGHDYGTSRLTESQRLELLEYLKSL